MSETETMTPVADAAVLDAEAIAGQIRAAVDMHERELEHLLSEKKRIADAIRRERYALGTARAMLPRRRKSQPVP